MKACHDPEGSWQATEHPDNERSQGKKEHTVDALARCGDEGRGELRKALGSCKLAAILGYPIGVTCLPSWAGTPR